MWTKYPFNVLMLCVDPGDIGISFRGRTITNKVVATSETIEARILPDHGARCDGRLDIGWLLLVDYEPVFTPYQPGLHMKEVLPVVSTKYPPLLNDGTGKQFYYTTLTNDLGRKLLELADYDS
jgi:hypothetical protein